MKIFELLPAKPSPAPIGGDGGAPFASAPTEGGGPRVGSCAVRPRPATLILRHEIVVKSFSLPEQPPHSTSDKNLSGGGKRKGVLSRVTSLATDESSTNKSGGTAILVGVAEGRHLCMWDMTSGATLLTALAIAPDRCKVDKVAWHAPSALVGLLYSEEAGPRRVDVHQLDIAGQTTTQVN